MLSQYTLDWHLFHYIALERLFLNNLPENIAKPQQQDKPLTVEEITAAVISAIKDNFTVEEQKTTPPDPKDDLEQRAAEILEDLDYI